MHYCAGSKLLGIQHLALFIWIICTNAASLFYTHDHFFYDHLPTMCSILLHSIYLNVDHSSTVKHIIHENETHGIQTRKAIVRVYKGASPRRVDAHLRLRERLYCWRMWANRGRKCDSTAKACIKKAPWLRQVEQRNRKQTLSPAPYADRYIKILVNRLKVHSRVMYPYVTQSCE